MRDALIYRCRRLMKQSTAFLL